MKPTIKVCAAASVVRTDTLLMRLPVLGSLLIPTVAALLVTVPMELVATQV